MAQEHSGRSVAQGTEAIEQGFLQGAFGGLGPAGALKRVAEDLAGAAVDDGHEDAPAIAAAMNQSEVGGPALIRMVGDGA